MSRGCGAVGREVASGTRDLQIPTSAMKYFESIYLSIAIQKRQKKEKEARNGPFKKEEDYNSLMGRILM